jgi:hypothetical protein
LSKFRITVNNNLLYTGLALDWYIDGECIYEGFIRAGAQDEMLGIQKSATSVLPLKFQELELAGAFPDSLGIMFVPHLLPKIQTWKMPLLCQKWGLLNFEPFAASS